MLNLLFVEVMRISAGITLLKNLLPRLTRQPDDFIRLYTDELVEVAADNIAAGKNISQLLSELYGEEDEEKKDAYSSVGKLMEYF